METLANLESFIRSADCGSFSAAARQLGVTPAAANRNVAKLERSLRVHLFQRSRRSLALTEDGERFLASITDGLDSTKLGPSES
jgi:DNA-binding transcriptional LysR family regulator